MRGSQPASIILPLFTILTQLLPATEAQGERQMGSGTGTQPADPSVSVMRVIILDIFCMSYVIGCPL